MGYHHMYLLYIKAIATFDEQRSLVQAITTFAPLTRRQPQHWPTSKDEAGGGDRRPGEGTTRRSTMAAYT